MRMFKVHNRKVIRRLAVRSYQAARTRNTIATFAVFLTAVLFTALFTIGSGLVDTVQRQTMRQYGGDYHGILKYLTRQQYETLSKDPLIRECADAMLVADQIKNQAFGKRHLEAWYYPAHYYSHCLFELVDGKNPEAEDEILLDEESLRLLGKEPVAGQQVTLAMMVKERTGKVEERTFTVSGVLRADPVLNTGFAIVSKTYVDAHAGELVDTFREDFSLTGTIRMNIIFHDRRDIQGKLYQVILNGGYSVDVNDPDYIDNNVNRAWLWDGLDIQTTAGMAGILLLILLTGYLIIYNIFQISVIRDIRYYGLLKTVGATGRQIRQIVRRQALRFPGRCARACRRFCTGQAHRSLVCIRIFPAYRRNHSTGPSGCFLRRFCVYTADRMDFCRQTGTYCGKSISGGSGALYRGQPQAGDIYRQTL